MIEGGEKRARLWCNLNLNIWNQVRIILQDDDAYDDESDDDGLRRTVNEDPIKKKVRERAN